MKDNKNISELASIYGLPSANLSPSLRKESPSEESKKESVTFKDVLKQVMDNSVK